MQGARHMTTATHFNNLAYAQGPPPLAQNFHKMQTHGALTVLIGITALCMLGNQAGLLQFVFPALSLGVGAILLWRHKPLYVGFVFWLWFVTPFIGRMADLQGGWKPSSPAELAPYIVAGIASLPLLASPRCLGSPKTLPYVCGLVAILYGFILGLTYLPLFNVMRALLNWVVPIIFGLFIYENRMLYREFRQAIEKAFLYGLLILGAYGIYQFFYLPDWDRMWMLNVQLNSFGEIEEMKIRAFSTMNAPAIYAAVMASGLLILFNMKGKLRLLSAALGFIGLILTMSRAAWLSLAAGYLYLMIFLGMRERIRLAIATLACAAFLFGFTQYPPVKDLVAQRMETFTQPGQDASLTARIEGHEAALLEIAQEPWGEGIGSTDTLHNTEGDDAIIGPHDSTILEFLYSLGWIGALIYGIGLFLLTARLFRSSRGDTFVLSSKAILAGFIVQAFLNSIMLGVLGFMVWTFASMALAQAEYAESPAEVFARETRQAAGYAAA
jgi:hypothetical protein